MILAPTILARRLPRPLPILLLGALALCVVGYIVRAQLEPGERGVPVIDSSASYEVGGVTVDTEARTADAARTAGWREAQRKGWRMLWAKVNGQPVSAAPGLPDSTLDGIVAGIVVEDEQIGPRRYIARLGVLFDRARAGQLLGVQGQVARSAPMLVIPVLYQGGGPVTFELRNEWQKAWARFRPAGSAIDYVRVTGVGSDPLLLNAAQAERPGRTWWRMILDQYGAADIVVPEVSLTRLWPGGPVLAHFIARHGPDGQVVASFDLRAESADAMPQMLDEGVRRIDLAYSQALGEGRLAADPSLLDQPAEVAQTTDEASDDSTAEEIGTSTTVAYPVQVDTPDAGAVSAAEASLRAVPGVKAVETNSLALGGVSVMRVAFQGDVDTLRLALAARGWRVEPAGAGLRIRRGAPAEAAPAAAVPPPARPGGR